MELFWQLEYCLLFIIVLCIIYNCFSFCGKDMSQFQIYSVIFNIQYLTLNDSKPHREDLQNKWNLHLMVWLITRIYVLVSLGPSTFPADEKCDGDTQNNFCTQNDDDILPLRKVCHWSFKYEQDIWKKIEKKIVW